MVMRFRTTSKIGVRKVAWWQPDQAHRAFAPDHLHCLTEGRHGDGGDQHAVRPPPVWFTTSATARSVLPLTTTSAPSDRARMSLSSDTSIAMTRNPMAFAY
jgi:hypothetical protein